MKKTLLICTPVGLILMSFFSLMNKVPKYEKISNKIVAESSKEIAEKYNLTIIGDGGSMMDDVKMLALSFNCDQPRNIEEARKLTVNCMNMFLENINKNESIRPYLHNYPFTEKNIEIMIFFRDKNEYRPAPPLIANITSTNGVIYYYIDKNNRYSDFHSESFSNAVQILQNQNSK
jgi:hypothetical protein